jgi:16S rRNA (cytosine1402-N4)-methyltransferase
MITCKVRKPVTSDCQNTSIFKESTFYKMQQEFFHQPVLADQVVEYLVTKRDGIYVDCTAGGGGHAELILKRINKNGILICLDADPDALGYIEKRLETYSNKILRNTYFDQLDIVLIEENLMPVSGFLFDLGLSSYQIDNLKRGFSFQGEGPLDMRFNPRQKLSAYDVVNNYPVESLQRIFREYGEVRKWRRVTDKIVEARHSGVIKTTGQLARIVSLGAHTNYHQKFLARIFQAIRIEVNNELNRLRKALEKAYQCLLQQGRIVVISYHSLEDRIVKDFFRLKATDCVCPPDFPKCVCGKEAEMRILSRKAIRPSIMEIEMNPRSRSARLRYAEKIIL